MKRSVYAFLLIIFLISGCATPSGPAAPPPVIETGVDIDAWAEIPAGPFLIGLHAHPATVENDYAMLVTLVTNAQYAEFLNQALKAGVVKRDGSALTGYYPGDPFHGYKHEEEVLAGDYPYLHLDEPDLRLIQGGAGFEVKSGYDNHPMVMVTWFGAKAYCEYYGWRLPSEIEWEKAARGDDGRSFPWGEEIAAGNANYYYSRDIFEISAGKLGDTTPVGFYNGSEHLGFQTLNSTSPYGLYDMAGNVWEWTGNVYEKTHYRFMRGGSKENHVYDLRVWTRNSAGPTYFSPNVGFRCARDVK